MFSMPTILLVCCCSIMKIKARIFFFFCCIFLCFVLCSCRVSWGLLSLHYCSVKLMWYDLFCLILIAVCLCSSDMRRPSDQPVWKLHQPTLPKLLPPHAELQLDHHCNYTYYSLIASKSVSHFVWSHSVEVLMSVIIFHFIWWVNEWNKFQRYQPVTKVTFSWVTLNTEMCFCAVTQKLLTPYLKQIEQNGVHGNVLLLIVWRIAGQTILIYTFGPLLEL